MLDKEFICAICVGNLVSTKFNFCYNLHDLGLN